MSNRAHLPCLDCDYVECMTIEREDFNLVCGAFRIYVHDCSDVSRRDVVFRQINREDHPRMFGYHGFPLYSG